MEIKILNKKVSLAVSIAWIFVVLLVVNLISSNLLGFIRLDLTSNKIFTLSAGTKNILNKLEEPITLKLFFSKQLAKDNPFLINFANRVEEFLKLYQKNSNNKITLQFIDPAPFTEEEDQAVHHGLQGVPINREGADLYFGIVGVNSTIGKEVIPFLQPNREGYLEYDISQLISKLSKQSLNKVSVISSLPIDGKNTGSTEPRPWLIWHQMQQQFNVNMLKENIDEIPTDTKVLLLINTGEALEHKTAKAIDKFVINGGNLLLMLDPNSEVKENIKLTAYQSEQDQGAKEVKIPISKLLLAWGVDYNANKIVASKHYAKQVRYLNQGKEATGLYPLWIDLNGSGLSKQDLLTANITKLTFPSAGVISANDNASSVFSPLVIVDQEPMLVEQENLSRYKTDPLSLLKEYQPQLDPVTIAARVTGEIHSAFGQKSTKQANIIVVANVDFIHDHFWANVQNFLGNPMFVPVSGNGTFVLNALDNLTGSNDLIGIRSKDHYTKGFDKIRQLELASQNKFQQTEAALLQKIEETKKKLASMDQSTLSLEHKKEEAAFRSSLIDARKHLRDVRKSLREEIQLLENRIKFFAIIFMPLMIIGAGISYWLLGDRFYKFIGSNRYANFK